MALHGIVFMATSIASSSSSNSAGVEIGECVFLSPTDTSGEIVEYNNQTFLRSGTLLDESVLSSYPLAFDKYADADNPRIWSSSVTPVATDILASIYANNICVLVGASGTVLTSSNATTWTKRAIATTADITAITYGLSLFVAVTSTGEIFTSPDAVTWSKQTSPSTVALKAIAFGGGVFVAMGLGQVSSTLGSYTSTDGITWTARAAISSQSGRTVLSLTYADTTFYAATITGAGTVCSMLTATSPLTANAFVSSGFDFSITASTVPNIRLFNGIYFATDASYGQVTSLGKIMTSTTPLVVNSWVGRDNGTDYIPPGVPTYAAGVLDIAYVNNLYVAITNLSTVKTSIDGVTWPRKSETAGINFTVKTVLTIGNKLLVAGGSGKVAVCDFSTAFGPKTIGVRSLMTDRSNNVMYMRIK